MNDDISKEAEGKDESTGAAEPMDELSMLKQRADLMGIKYSPNIGVASLKAKIEEKKTAPVEPAPVDAAYAAEELATINAAAAVANGDIFTQGVRETPAQINMKRRQEALKLVRIRVTNMNPLKGNLKGDIFSVGNSQIGFIKKFVPYNVDAGWHVPQIILTHMQQKKYMTHYEVKIGNKKVKKHRLVPELAIEILPPLTAAELQELKQRQLMASGGQ
jgi:hypothetical protein